MNRHEIANVLKSQGWEEDRYGNLKAKSGVVRVKFQANSMRVERKITYKPSPFYTKPPEWVNVVSDYYKDITLVDGQVAIKGRKIKIQSEAA